MPLPPFKGEGHLWMLFFLSPPGLKAAEHNHRWGISCTEYQVENSSLTPLLLASLPFLAHPSFHFCFPSFALLNKIMHISFVLGSAFWRSQAEMWPRWSLQRRTCHLATRRVVSRQLWTIKSFSICLSYRELPHSEPHLSCHAIKAWLPWPHMDTSDEQYSVQSLSLAEALLGLWEAEVWPLLLPSPASSLFPSQMLIPSKHPAPITLSQNLLWRRQCATGLVRTLRVAWILKPNWLRQKNKKGSW